MTDPWDRPPIPKRGNRSDKTLFEALGRTLNAWEEIEISMSHLYAAFSVYDRFDGTATHAYGVPANFRDRMTLLQRAADLHFIAHPNQEVEGEFHRLMRFAEGYSARRNDIAHSRASQIVWALPMPDTAAEFVEIRDREEWCLIPPFFRAKKFTPDRRPTYAFTSRELNELGKVFWDIAHAFTNLSIMVSLHRYPPSRGIRPRPSVLPYMIRDPRIR